MMLVYLPFYQETYAGAVFAPASDALLTCGPGGVTSTERVLRKKISSSRTVVSTSAASATSADGTAFPLRPSAALAALASHSSTSLPTVSFVLQVPTENPALLFPPDELQKHLQNASTEAGVHLSPYALQCLRRHVLRSLLASRRYFMPPLLPRILLPPLASPRVSHQSAARGIRGGRSSPAPDQRFYISPEVVVHLVFQSWKNYLFLPVDAAAAAAIGFIPLSPDDAVASATLAAWSCLAVERQRRSSTRHTAALDKHKQDENATFRYGFNSRATVTAVNSVIKEAKDVERGVETHISSADDLLCRNTAFLPQSLDILPSAADVVDSQESGTPLSSHPLPLSLCAREAALRALAYWSCLAELQEIEVHKLQYEKLALNDMQEWRRREENSSSERDLTSFMDTSCGEDVSSIRLVHQLRQSYHSVIKNVLKRQKEALDQLRERQSREMEEVSGRKELMQIPPVTLVFPHDTHHCFLSSTTCERTPAGSPPRSSLLSAGGAPLIKRYAGFCNATSAVASAEIGAAAASTSADAFPINTALREEVVAGKECSNEGKEGRPHSTTHHHIDASSNSVGNTCGINAPPVTTAAKHELVDDTLERLVNTGLSSDLGSVNHVEAVHTQTDAQSSTLPVAEKPDNDSGRSVSDIRPSSNQRDKKDAAGRGKIEALVLQHVSEFQLVEMHWKAESLLLRRQQLQDLKDVIVDLVLLRRAARQGSLASPLVLPPLPSAFEGDDAVQLLPKKMPFARTDSARGAADRESAKLSSSTSTGLEEEGNYVLFGLRALFENLPRRPAHGEKQNRSEGNEPARNPPQRYRFEAAQVQHSVMKSVGAIPGDAEAQEIQHLLRMYLPARRGRGKESGTKNAEEAVIQTQQQALTSRSQVEDQSPGLDAARLSLPVEYRKYSTSVEVQGRSPLFIGLERDISSVQQKALCQDFPRSLREPLPAALQLVTPTRLLRGFLHQQQQRRRTVDDRQQAQAPVTQGGRATQICGSRVCHRENEGRRLPDAGTIQLPKKTLSSYFYRNACTADDISDSSRPPETRISGEEKAGAGALTQLEVWEDTVKSWAEEDALGQLQQHAFLPLVFGKQRKRSVIIRICSGNITDIAVCDQGNSAIGENNVRATGSHLSTRDRIADTFHANTIKTPVHLPFAMAKPASTWGDYDYCSDLAAAPRQCPDKLLSEVFMSLKSGCCSQCGATSANPGTDAKQLNKVAPVHSAKRETAAGAVGASSTATYTFEKSIFLPSAQAHTTIRETADDTAGMGIRRPHVPTVANRTAVGAAAAARTDSSKHEHISDDWLAAGGCSARAAPWGTLHISQSKKTRRQYPTSLFPLLGPSGAGPEFGTFGVVLPVGSLLRLTAPSHLRWQSHVSDTTDFVFPSLEEQRQMLYRALLQEQHYGHLLDARLRGELEAWRRMTICEETGIATARRRSRNKDDTSPADDWYVQSVSSAYRCAPSRLCAPQLHLGDVFVSRHSNSGPIQLVFHLVVHEDRALQEDSVRGERPALRIAPEKARGKETIPACVLQGIGEVLRISSTEGLRTLLIPLLLVEGEAAICSLPYSRLQQRAFQVVRYIVNELKNIYQDNSDAPSLRQLVLVLPRMPMNTAAARRILPKRANSKHGAPNLYPRSTSGAVFQNMEQTIDTRSREPLGGVGDIDSSTVENELRCDKSGACQQHPSTALTNEPLPVDCYMEGVLTSIIAYVRNCGHCWVGKANSRSLCRIPPT